MTVVAGFSRPAAGSSVLLTHSKAETLFHEIGHVTHHMSDSHCRRSRLYPCPHFTQSLWLTSLLLLLLLCGSFCRNRYQHLSGARGELDFVELPSILFEQFIWDYRVLRHFAVHHRTNAVIPQTMVDNLSRSRRLFFAIDTCAQAQLVAHSLSLPLSLSLSLSLSHQQPAVAREQLLTASLRSLVSLRVFCSVAVRSAAVRSSAAAVLAIRASRSHQRAASGLPPAYTVFRGSAHLVDGTMTVRTESHFIAVVLCRVVLS